MAVIGGSTGIGLETARLLAGRGAQVTVGGRNRYRLDAAVKQLGDRAQAVAVDAEQADSLRQFFAQAGPISDLVITVTRRGGAAPPRSWPRPTCPEHSPARPSPTSARSRLALATLADDGSITLVTAGSAQSALPGTAGLAAVNGALEAAVAPLASELAPRRVNAVSPGVIETGWWDELPVDAKEEAFTTFAQRALVRRNGRPEDVAHAIVALVENGFITGVVLPCDGGLRLHLRSSQTPAIVTQRDWCSRARASCSPTRRGHQVAWPGAPGKPGSASSARVPGLFGWSLTRARTGRTRCLPDRGEAGGLRIPLPGSRRVASAVPAQPRLMSTVRGQAFGPRSSEQSGELS